MKIFFAGDIVGNPGREAVKKLYRPLKSEHSIDLFIANGENAAGGSGITRKIGYELHDAGVDVITLGDHSWRNKDVFNAIAEDNYLLRPANYPNGTPGACSAVLTLENGVRVGVVSLLGRVYMPPIDCPFRAVDRELVQLREIIANGNAESIETAFMAAAEIRAQHIGVT